ncbi:MAG TPA: hypothetical protein VMZ28_04935 [Kofleriaceae bacterium]|nr:hypothetical protein [Kofleriaceae bacterium]
MVPRRRRILLGLAALVVATALWLPALGLVFAQPAGALQSKTGVPPRARAMAAHHLALWNDPALRAAAVGRMRAANAEWDFMGRSFLVWSLANLALRDPAAKPEALAVIDRILDETLRLEREEGMYVFLMPYAKDKAWQVEPKASQFLDGEIALMLGARCLVEDKPAYRAALTERVDRMAQKMAKSPVLSAESYPDECWTFCNTVGLAAIRVHDRLAGTRAHDALLAGWVAAAKRSLVDRKTGLLVSSYTVGGAHLDGPEGSSIWLSAHMLALVDPAFARDQYERARRELSHHVLGFGYAGEWPASWQGPRDIDSGPVIPLLDVSAGSSGLAFVGAAAFGDDAYLAELSATVDFAGFPIARGGTLRYAASNQVGDAVMLYALLLGPLWERAR